MTTTAKTENPLDVLRDCVDPLEQFIPWLETVATMAQDDHCADGVREIKALLTRIRSVLETGRTPEFSEQQRQWILNGLRADRDALKDRARRILKRFDRCSRTAEIYRPPSEYIAHLMLAQVSILDSAIGQLTPPPESSDE